MGEPRQIFGKFLASPIPLGASTNGFRAEWAATLQADTRGAVETGRRRAVRAIDAIHPALAGLPILIAA